MDRPIIGLMGGKPQLTLVRCERHASWNSAAPNMKFRSVSASAGNPISRALRTRRGTWQIESPVEYDEQTSNGT